MYEKVELLTPIKAKSVVTVNFPVGKTFDNIFVDDADDAHGIPSVEGRNFDEEDNPIEKVELDIELATN